MATQVPAGLKTADITRFVHRASQLENAKPIVAYWCEYWIVNQILSKGLHNADQECLIYTTTLMDKLEQYKSQHPDEPAITDDMVGKAYVEQFGLETFERADNAVRANKASRQTADTYQAAATFLDLLQVWGPLEPEIAAKVKYAKYHALRIAKALKAGEDPNLSNPKQETPAEEQLPALDPDDAEVRALQGNQDRLRQPSVVDVPDEADHAQKGLAQKSVLDESLHPSRDTSMPPPARRERQPSVVEIADEADKIQSNLAQQSSLNQSLHPSRLPSGHQSPANDISPIAPQDVDSYYTNPSGQDDVSPLDPPAERKPSLGGNYFPQVPLPVTFGRPADASRDDDMPDLPSAPSDLATRHQSPPPPAHTHGTILPFPAPDQQPQIPPNFQPRVPPPQIPQNPPQLRASHGPVPPVPQPNQSVYSQIQAPPPHPVNVVVDEEAVMKAQKHARWAISALNFEDVPTAIKELRGALASLGAS